MSNASESVENVAPGVRVGRDETTGIEYIGSEEALILGGYAKAEWFVGLGGFRRFVSRLADGTYIVLGEGKGNRVTNLHKENGACSIGRNRDASFSVFVYRHPDEYRKRKAKLIAERDAEHAAWVAKQEEKKQKEAWVLAKEAHSEGDFPKRWKDGVLYHLGQAEKLIKGEMVFTDFPDVGLSSGDIAAACAAVTELRRVLQSCRPKIKDRIQVSNVVSLSAYAYRNMKRG